MSEEIIRERTSATADAAVSVSASDAAIARHTPGPWDDASRYGNISTIRIFAGSHYIATVGGPDDDFSETDANAKLIAAAPEMKDALGAVDRALAWDGSLPRPDDVLDRNELERLVRAAIAKAEGQ